ncbi:Holliday junction branch migration protein RuvA [Naasia sp. SYSU D00948]|uniref:Holliday junction branch migration protein RuvA n=1 Tax=Naasia sp. SYSU D00948 TaxID=2817379 RepID=UPI001B315E4C|nr:Holliday junction branch migration protein RuvA [Naasia sp. SYSU D00948]
MISSLRGTVLGLAGGSVVVEVGGIGYSVAVTPQHALSLRTGQEVLLHTALVVREDDLSLFGFADVDALRVFDLLRGVTGVGPKSAMGVLASMTPDQVATAVASEDDSAFRKVSGIGPKTAKLIVVSLAGKLFAPARPAVASVPAAVGADVVVALVGLGWPERTAQQTVDEILADASADRSTPALLRAALALLGPRQLSGTVS